ITLRHKLKHINTMDYKTLQLNLSSAKYLNNVNLFSKMQVYVVVSFSGDPKSLTLEINIHCPDSLAINKDMGSVQVPLGELLKQTGDGKPKGSFSFSYKFTEPVNHNHKVEPIMITGYPSLAMGCNIRPDIRICHLHRCTEPPMQRHNEEHGEDEEKKENTLKNKDLTNKVFYNVCFIICNIFTFHNRSTSGLKLCPRRSRPSNYISGSKYHVGNLEHRLTKEDALKRKVHSTRNPREDSGR
ncbi:hypothetical protein RYX36_012763, partial [Vicia faba]